MGAPRGEEHFGMAARDQLVDLARHMEWADATLWKAILAAPEAAGDAGLAETLHHIHLVQHIFRQAWNGGEIQIRESAGFQRLGALAVWGRDVHTEIQAFFALADAQELERVFRLPWATHFEQGSNRLAQSHTLGESMLQVALHTAHHRGQVCRRLRQIGGEPPLIDFIVWLWAGRPAADWAYLDPSPSGD
jgi:uncharacterized damage-inducible protein DinB